MVTASTRRAGATLVLRTRARQGQLSVGGDGRVSGDGELARGREAAQRHAWADAYAELSTAEKSAPLPGEDLQLMAAAAYLLGRTDECLHALQRAQQAHVGADDHRQAARCVFWLAFILLLQGDLAPASGWLGRAHRLLEHNHQECAERGLLLLPDVLLATAAGDYASAEMTAARATEIGVRAGDADLHALALHFHGRALLKHGRIHDGLPLLDESMVAVVADELSPFVAGNLYCSMIDACQEIAELRRAHEWTAALTAWCGKQPDLITFTGQCLVHRAEIMQLHGAWAEAVEEATRARERFAGAADEHATGSAWYRQAEIHRVRGEKASAEECYRRSSEWGHEPQPGLALLHLTTGEVETAAVAIRRVLAETPDRLRRAKLLPVAVEIMLETGDVDPAQDAADELADIVGDYDTPALRASAAHARGAILLARGDPSGALLELRRAWQLWRELNAPYEAACVRVLIGLGCRALGDEEAAVMEIASARRVLVQLGAAPEVARTERLTRRAAETDRHGLTIRELQVLRLVATGKTNSAIAVNLVLSEKTVDKHVSSILTKLGVPSRTAATSFAHEHRLL